MATKTQECCNWCNHPIVKMLVEFYCLVWGVIGLLFLIGMIWGLVKFRTLNPQNFSKGMMWGQAQNQSGQSFLEKCKYCPQ